MKHPFFIVFSGFNDRAVVAFCRWATEQDIRFAIVARGLDDLILLTDYKAKVSLIRNTPAFNLELFKDIKEELRTLLSSEDQPVIVPSSEYLNRYLINNYIQLTDLGFEIPLCNEGIYTAISDKESFTDICANAGIPIPRRLNRVPAKPPFVLKPKQYKNSDGMILKPKLILTESDMRGMSSNVLDSYFIQEYVVGESHYLLAHIGPDSHTLFAQENLMQQTQGGSIILAKPSQFHIHDDAKKYTQCLVEMGFHGLIMIEVRKCELSGQHVMIEANPRLWGPIQFTLDSGIDLFASLFQLRNSKALQPVESQPFYYWSGGITKSAAPIQFHHFSPADYIHLLPLIKQHDIFGRPDTVNVYLHQLRDAHQ